MTNTTIGWVQDVSGYWSNPKLSDEVRVIAQPLTFFRQLTTPQENIGPQMGNEFKFTKVGDMDSYGMKIGEFDEVPTAGIPISVDSFTTDEYTNSLNYSWWTTIYSEVSAEHAWVIALQNNYLRTLDYFIANVYRQSELIYVPTGSPGNKSYVLITDGVLDETATRPFTAWDHKNVIGIMSSDYKIPAYDNEGNYLCICEETGSRSLRDDAEIIEAQNYAAPHMRFTGELGKYHRCRFVQENHVLNGAYPGNLGEMIYMGQDACAEGEVYPFEIQAMVSEQYGRIRGLRWVWIGGWKLVWNLAKDGHTRTLRVASQAA